MHIEKDDKDRFIFPLVTGEFTQPYGNGKSFTRFVKNFVDVEEDDETAKAWLDSIMPEGDDDDVEDRTEESGADAFTLEDKGDSEDILDRDPFEEAEAAIEGQDYWTLNGTCLVRHHRVPRTRLFSPYDIVEKKPPIPLDYVDLRRETYTSLESPKEAVIMDTWWLPASLINSIQPIREDEEELSAPWAGKTRFNLLMNAPRPGYDWCEGEELKVSYQTTRPGNINPYNWSQLSRAQRKKRRKAWEDLQVIEKPLRDIRKRNVIPPEESERYNMILADQIKRTTRPAAPAMPCIATSSTSTTSNSKTLEATPRTAKAAASITSSALSASTAKTVGAISCTAQAAAAVDAELDTAGCSQ